MAKLADTNLWIGLTRLRSPRTLKEFVRPYLEDAGVHLAKPIAFEVRRHASEAEAPLLAGLFATLPWLDTPPDVWSKGVELGQACRRRGVSAGSLDLLIAVVALHHDAELITFDADFEAIARVAPLRVTRLVLPNS